MKLNKKKIVIVIVVLLIICAIGGVYFQNGKTNNKKAVQGDSTAITPVPKKVLSLIDSVKKKSQLPQDETPTVATVSDPEKLQDQAFFAKAKMGDKVLMYLTAQKAFLYRPSTDEIIQISPLEMIAKDATESAAASATASGKVEGSPILRVRF